MKYIFEDEKVFKEEKVKAEKGQLLDSGNLPMLPDDMKFIDEFLFYEVKGDGNDEIIRKVAKIEVKDKETQTEEEKPKQDESTQTETPKTEDKGTQTKLSKDDISKMEKEKEVRYPNKLTPKAPANNSQDSSMDATSKAKNTNKGVASTPSKARGTVTENKNNANKDYPIHHGDEREVETGDYQRGACKGRSKAWIFNV